MLRDGKPTTIPAVRGDLFLDKTALEEPIGGGKPLGIYVMDLAESDPDALSSSLVLEADQEFRLDKKKRPLEDESGNPLPPLWRPTKLHGFDVVDTGDAVDGLLSAQLGFGDLPDGLVRQATQVLDQAFPEAERSVVESRVKGWLAAYLAYRFDEEPAELAKKKEKPTPAEGDAVMWKHEQPEQMCAHLCHGTLMALSDDEDLSIPGTSISMKAPAALVACDMDGDGAADKWHLVDPDKLELDESDTDAPAGDGGPDGGMSARVGGQIKASDSLAYDPKTGSVVAISPDLRTFATLSTTSRSKAELDTLLASAGEPHIESLTIPPDPPGGGGKAVAGEWSKPTLADFTDKAWSDLTDAERKKIACYFAWYSSLDTFGDLKLPHHFAKGPNKGKASLDGVRNALARLDQVQGIPPPTGRRSSRTWRIT